MLTQCMSLHQANRPWTKHRAGYNMWYSKHGVLTRLKYPRAYPYACGPPGCSNLVQHSPYSKWSQLVWRRWHKISGWITVLRQLSKPRSMAVLFQYSTVFSYCVWHHCIFSNYMGGLIYVGAKDMTDAMHVNTVNDTRPSKYAGDHIQALQSQLYPSRLQMAIMVS